MEKTNLFKKKYGILLDTETIMHEGKTLVYDLAWMVIDNQGNILSRHNYIVDEVFNNFPAMFDSHFVTYDKYQTYQTMIQDRQVKFWNAYNIFRRLARTIADFDISFITAYNLGFDLRALKETAQYFDAVNPLETRADSLIFLDLWKLSQSHIATRPYQKHCQVHGWLTEKRKQPKTTAETVYRWISKDDNFIESHTALADCEIEVIIYRKCKQKKKRIPENAYLTY